MLHVSLINITQRLYNFSSILITQNLVNSMWALGMVLILDGNSAIGAPVRSNVVFFICSRHLIRSRGVTYRIIFSLKKYFVLSYQLIYCVSMKSWPILYKNGSLLFGYIVFTMALGSICRVSPNIQGHGWTWILFLWDTPQSFVGPPWLLGRSDGGAV